MTKEKSNTAVALAGQPGRGGGLLETVVEAGKNLVQRFQPEQLKRSAEATAALDAQRKRLEELEGEQALLEQQQKTALFDDTACAEIEQRIFMNAQERSRIKARIQVLEQTRNRLMQDEESAAVLTLVEKSNRLQLAVERLYRTEYVEAARRIAMIMRLAAEAESIRTRTAPAAEQAGIKDQMLWLSRMLPGGMLFQSVVLRDPREEKEKFWCWNWNGREGRDAGMNDLKLAAYMDALLSSDSPEKVLEQMLSDNPEKAG